MEFTPLSSVAHSKTSNRIHWTYFRMNFNSLVLGVFQYATVHLLDSRGQLYLSKNVTKKSWEYLVLAKVVFAICFPVAGIVTRQCATNCLKSYQSKFGSAPMRLKSTGNWQGYRVCYETTRVVVHSSRKCSIKTRGKPRCLLDCF